MIFSKEELQDLLYGDSDHLEVIENKLTDTSRWSTHYKLIFKDKNTNQFYKTKYRKGATEYQEERPFEDEDTIDCKEVFPVEKIIIVYE